MSVEMKPVESSNVAAIGHDSDADELHVQFRSGATHVYGGVDAEKHQELLDAPSIGSHLSRVIRINHPSRKL